MAGAVGQALDRSVIMQGQPVHHLPAPIVAAAGFAHHDLGPIIIIVARAAGDAEEFIVAVIAGIQAVALIQIGIIFRVHPAAAAPVLVAHAEIFQLPGFAAPIAAAQVGHRALAVKGDVLDPLRHFLDGAAAHIARR